MNPASHLLIAAPCYFTWTVLTFLLSFPLPQRGESFQFPFYLSTSSPRYTRLDPEIGRFRLFPFSPFLGPSPKNVGAFNGNSKILRFLSVKYWTELGSKCFERLRTCIDFPQSFPAPGGLSGKRIQIAEHGGA